MTARIIVPGCDLGDPTYTVTRHESGPVTEVTLGPYPAPVITFHDAADIDLLMRRLLDARDDHMRAQAYYQRDEPEHWQKVAAVAEAADAGLADASTLPPLPQRDRPVRTTVAAVPPGGIDCTCGHTIVEDGTCCCPLYCPTCIREDCCAESWANHDLKIHATTVAAVHVTGRDDETQHASQERLKDWTKGQTIDGDDDEDEGYTP